MVKYLPPKTESESCIFESLRLTKPELVMNNTDLFCCCCCLFFFFHKFNVALECGEWKYMFCNEISGTELRNHCSLSSVRFGSDE